MASIKFSRNLGLMLVGVWFILYGVIAMFSITLPTFVLGLLGPIAGVLVFVEYKD